MALAVVTTRNPVRLAPESAHVMNSKRICEPSLPKSIDEVVDSLMRRLWMTEPTTTKKVEKELIQANAGLRTTRSPWGL